MPPRISLITTAFNAQSTIARTLESALSQHYSDFEHIIIDAKSTDKTLAIAQEFRERYEARGVTLRIFSQKDSGIYDGMNRGLGYAKGEIVGFLNADDFFAANDILDFVAWGFDKPDSPQIIYANVAYITARGSLSRQLKGKIFSKLGFKLGSHPPHPSFYVRREVIERLGGFDERFRIAADYEMMLRLLYKHALKSFYIDKCFVKMQLGGASNAGISSIFKANIECAKAWQVNGLSACPLFIVLKPLSKLKDKLFSAVGGENS